MTKPKIEVKNIHPNQQSIDKQDNKNNKFSDSQSYDENSLESINEVENSIAESCSPKALMKRRSNTNLIDNIKPEILIESVDKDNQNQNNQIFSQANGTSDKQDKYLRVNQPKVK